jgi:NAD+ kinase
MKLAFVAALTDVAAAARARLTALYGDAPPREAEVVVALGGDGLMLECLHRCSA